MSNENYKERYIKFFEQLPPGYRERANLRFSQKQKIHDKMLNPRNLGDALCYGCMSTFSSEGMVFWDKLTIWADYPDTEEIPILPPP